MSASVSVFVPVPGVGLRTRKTCCFEVEMRARNTNEKLSAILMSWKFPILHLGIQNRSVRMNVGIRRYKKPVRSRERAVGESAAFFASLRMETLVEEANDSSRVYIPTAR